MKPTRLTLFALILTGFAAAQAVPAEYDAVLKSLGKQGDFKDNVLKINIPRNDLKVTIDGIATPTPHLPTTPSNPYTPAQCENASSTR